MKSLLLRAVGSALLVVAPVVVSAQTIVDEWSSVKAPPAPVLKDVTVDPKTTALLMLDFVPPTCGTRPRCLASLPALKKLLEDARSKGMLVVHSVTATTKAEDILKDVAPRAGEPIVASSIDKFRNTELEKILKDRGIQTVIVTGTAAHGAVLNTIAGAVQRGFKVVLPVDGMSASDTYTEQYVAWHMTNAPAVAPNTTLTKISLLKF
ncbi:MAG TPA: cysteine hydrolase [Burkholderiaceae bacterium]|nr:cysteine hydrolase [Burkholderiaceae bacterium]